MLNRAPIFAAIQEQIERSKSEPSHFALVVVRVSGLRDINIRFGCDRGEQAEENAQVLISESLRPVDRVFRVGDESYAVLLPGLHTQSHALLAATRIVRSFEQPLNRATSPWQGRPIMGIVFHPEHGRDADELYRRAELAVDEAQRRGENYAFYELHEVPMEIVYHDLRDAIEANRLSTYFQPIWDLKAQRIVGAESLARWHNARVGGSADIGPAQFVPFAEQSDLISALTRWSINASLRHAAAMRETQGFSIAINLSPRVFVKPGLLEQIMDALQIWGLPPTAVVAEVTETAFVNDLQSTVKMLRRLRDQGLRIAIDDFGTGYSSIAYLAKFPATELKIDKSLIGGVRSDARTEKLVRAIVKLAHHMDLTVTAEGIEDQGTQDLLLDMECNFGQGYHLGRPEPAANFVSRYATPTESAALAGKG